VLLEDAGLVESAGETRRRSYRITPEPLSNAMEWMVDVGATWDSRLGRLKRLLERR
jgi:DNA-binding PadR family transcriptional regulator